MANTKRWVVGRNEKEAKEKAAAALGVTPDKVCVFAYSYVCVFVRGSIMRINVCCMCACMHVLRVSCSVHDACV